MTLHNRTVGKMTTTLVALCLLGHSALLQAAMPSNGRVHDVELYANGILTTRVVDLQGNPVANENVTVMYQGKEIATGVSDKDGYVAVSGLRPGAHTLMTSTTAVGCRFWSQNTAPPAAVKVPALVSDAEIVRGQFGAFNLPMLVYAGVSAAALIVAIDAGDEADQARSENAALQARVAALEAASP